MKKAKIISGIILIAIIFGGGLLSQQCSSVDNNTQNSDVRNTTRSMLRSIF